MKLPLYLAALMLALAAVGCQTKSPTPDTTRVPIVAAPEPVAEPEPAPVTAAPAPVVAPVAPKKAAPKKKQKDTGGGAALRNDQW